jgi:uncharacterized protein (TIGR02391 family)
MNLQTQIKNDLWLAVQSTYEAGNYSHAIVDSMHYLSNIIREKTGVDGDGKTLIGQAFGGDSPRLRINKLQTETERNEQQGIESILRGMYQAIRNPRSHEQIEDKQETADAIIYFINYLLSVIERSEEPFVISKFLGRVFDPDFYKSQQYAELLVNEIPSNKRFDVLVAIYRDKLTGDIYNVGLIVKALIAKLSDEQIKQFTDIVSDELIIVSDEKDFRYIIHLLPPQLWEQLQEAPRLRAENRIIKAIKEGEATGEKCRKGALATWARGQFRYFKLKEQVGIAFTEKLESDSIWSQNYAIRLFLAQLPDVVLSSYRINKCVRAIDKSIRNGNISIRNALVDNIYSLPEDWRGKFADSLKDLIDEANQTYLPDGTPFIAKITEIEVSESEEGDIPF